MISEHKRTPWLPKKGEKIREKSEGGKAIFQRPTPLEQTNEAKSFLMVSIVVATGLRKEEGRRATSAVPTT